MSAVPIHLGKFRPGELRRVGQAIVRTLADSNETLEIVVAEEITAQKQLRYLLDSGTFDTAEGRDLLRDRPQIPDTDFDALRALPDGTLGREFVRFLDDHGLDPQLLRVRAKYTDDPECAYVMERLRQCHDLWHVLIGLGTRGHEEVMVHAFSVAQTGFPASLMIIGLGAIKHMVLERRWGALRHGLRAAHSRGSDANPLLAAYWERHWEKPLEDVREYYGVTPMPVSS